MKAISLRQHGGPETLIWDELPTPCPKPNEALIRIQAAALNRVDIWVRKGIPAYPVTLPHVLGADGSGVVEAVGSDVEGVSPGDRVTLLPGLSCGLCEECRNGLDNQCAHFEILGAKRWGTYAEKVTVPDDNVCVIPDSLSFVDAAAFPLAFLTAWHMLAGRGQLLAGETVLVVGAGGGVATSGIQIARALGARVLAVTTKPDKVERIKSLGADAVFVAGEKKGFSEWARSLTNGGGVNVVLEHVGPETWDESLKSLARAGRLVTCGATTGPQVSLELRTLFSRDLSVLGARMGTKKEFRKVADLIFSGTIKPAVDKTFPLAEAAEAHSYMESNQQVGKIVLTAA